MALSALIEMLRVSENVADTGDVGSGLLLVGALFEGQARYGAK